MIILLLVKYFVCSLKYGIFCECSTSLPGTRGTSVTEESLCSLRVSVVQAVAGLLMPVQAVVGLLPEKNAVVGLDQFSGCLLHSIICSQCSGFWRPSRAPLFDNWSLSLDIVLGCRRQRRLNGARSGQQIDDLMSGSWSRPSTGLMVGFISAWLRSNGGKPSAQGPSLCATLVTLLYEQRYRLKPMRI